LTRHDDGRQHEDVGEYTLTRPFFRCHVALLRRNPQPRIQPRPLMRQCANAGGCVPVPCCLLLCVFSKLLPAKKLNALLALFGCARNAFVGRYMRVSHRTAQALKSFFTEPLRLPLFSQPRRSAASIFIRASPVALADPTLMLAGLLQYQWQGYYNTIIRIVSQGVLDYFFTRPQCVVASHMRSLFGCA
jgi:hypothetical protein